MKYWAYMKGEVPGSYEPEALAALPDFTLTTLVCPGEGEIAEKSWRCAGEFDDIVRAHGARQSPLPAALDAPSASNDADALLDAASARLFSHVADLMKELAVQRTDRAALARLQADLAARERQLNELRIAAEKTRGELESAKRRLQETETDLGIRNRLVDKLSRDLSEKSLSLAKALGVIRRLEEDLQQLCPSPEKIEPAPAAVLSVPEAKTPAAPAPSAAAFTSDDPPPPPPYLEPRAAEPPQAQQALMSLLRKVFPGQAQ